MTYLDQSELAEFHFLKLGENVQISSDCRIYESSRISIGNNVRIDDFAVISGNVTINDNVHISCGAKVTATIEPIVIGIGSSLSYNCSVFSASDDFIGHAKTNPTFSVGERNVHHERIDLGNNVVIGANCVILPGSKLEDGCSVGALSLVQGHLQTWKIYAGIPVREIGERSS